MADKPKQEPSSEKDMDERTSIPLDPKKARSGLLKVDPESPETAAAAKRKRPPAGNPSDPA